MYRWRAEGIRRHLYIRNIYVYAICLYVIYTYTYVYTPYRNICAICVSICPPVCMYFCIYVYVRTYVCICIYIHAHICICPCSPPPMCIYAYMYMQIRTYVRTYTYIQKYIYAHRWGRTRHSAPQRLRTSRAVPDTRWPFPMTALPLPGASTVLGRYFAVVCVGV